MKRVAEFLYVAYAYISTYILAPSWLAVFARTNERKNKIADKDGDLRRLPVVGMFAAATLS